MRTSKAQEGDKYNRLTLLHLSHKHNRHQYWHIVCDCGNEKVISVSDVIRGTTKSCGCLLREKRINSNKHHYGHGTPLYHCWLGMRRRCTSETHPKYHRYGGRGIKICDGWFNDFRVFREWAYANGYKEHLTIDRIDNDGNYEPDNCQWLTRGDNTKKRFGSLRDENIPFEDPEIQEGEIQPICKCGETLAFTKHMHSLYKKKTRYDCLNKKCPVDYIYFHADLEPMEPRTQRPAVKKEEKPTVKERIK
ncbi:MAG: hypothetical protein JRI65_14810, partial [Deltaproteobacteria bacterium]|nr:hypothetical protein [Deltaproteobacteria bacterium]